MNSTSAWHDPAHLESVSLYALQGLPSSEMAAVAIQISTCSDCRRELDAILPVIRSFTWWPTDLLRPSTFLWGRLAKRLALDTTPKVIQEAVPLETFKWEETAPGIACKLLATDLDKNRVSTLVRLAPGTDYPPHRHAGIEELYLLYGELFINEKRIYPGDYVRAEAETIDHRVWSETGCTCVLLTSIQDVILI